MRNTTKVQNQKKNWDRQNAYNRKHYKERQLRLRIDQYPQLMNWLELVPFNEYVRGLIMADLLERQERGEIGIDDKTGEIEVLMEVEDLKLSADSCSKWNLEDGLPEGAEDIWGIEHKKGRKKKVPDSAGLDS